MDGFALDPWMIVTAIAIVSLPFILMTVFNAGDRTDARGRRTNRKWTSTRQ